MSEREVVVCEAPEGYEFRWTYDDCSSWTLIGSIGRYRLVKRAECKRPATVTKAYRQFLESFLSRLS